MIYNGADIVFPHLGIVIQTIKNGIMIGSFRIAYYGIIIGIGFLAGMFLVEKTAKSRGLDPDAFFDFFIWVIIAGVVGARLYYVAFNWEDYSANPAEIFNIRGGGLAIYGGIIGVVAALVIWCRARKRNFLVMIDTLVPGLLLGQSIGRWGNFFNCEAFGGYTDSLFAMMIRRPLASSYMIDSELAGHIVTDGATEYIQVHPTFLYESVWNLASLAFVLWFIRKKQKRDGDIILLYMLLYGTGRSLIEGLRTDSLYIWGTTLRVSQCLSLAAAVSAAVLFAVRHFGKKPAVLMGKPCGEDKDGAAAEDGCGAASPPEDSWEEAGKDKAEGIKK